MISIITPVYNGENFIKDCIKVVANQNCLDVEHIIIDGGSTDKTAKIIEKCASKYPHLKWISEYDNGQSDAMNKGINLARGKIIGILNVDDFYESNILNKILTIFIPLPEPSLVVGNCNILDSKNRVAKVNRPAKLNVVDLITQRHPFPLNPSAYFYHKSLHEKIGPYNVDEHYMMDLEFIIKAVHNANVEYIDETFGNHRQIQGAKTVELKKSGRHSKYLLNFLAQERRKLPLIYKFQILPIQIKQKIQFFLKNPRKLYPSFKRKLKNFFSHYKAPPNIF